MVPVKNDDSMAIDPTSDAEVPRFVVDAMLGRLARWLRVLGFDTFFDPAVHDHELVRLADAQDRVLLTRDRHLLRALRPRRALEIREDAALEQLRAVITALQPPRPPGLFTRCTLCNGWLEPVSGDRATALLPAGLRAGDGPVWQCTHCGHAYWVGSHVRRMRATLAHALPDWLPPDEPAQPIG